MNAEKLYDAFAQIDEDLFCDTVAAKRRAWTIKPRMIVAAAIVLFVVGAVIATFYLTRGGGFAGPGDDSGTQIVQPSEQSAADVSEENPPAEPQNNYFESDDLEGFLDFINNGGKTLMYNNSGGHFWSEYAENAEFIEWVNGKAQIPVPGTASGFNVTYSCVGEKKYCFYISTSDEKLTAQVTIEEISSDQAADLPEIVRRYMTESGKAYYDADGEHISGECKFGEYVLYDRHPWKSEFQGEETTSICPPVLFFRYGDYLVRVADRRNPEAEKWDIHFLDCFDLEMYEIQR